MCGKCMVFLSCVSVFAVLYVNNILIGFQMLQMCLFQTDYELVLLTLCSKPYQGYMISVQRLQLSKMIQIHGIGNLSKEIIELHFEHPMSGGGSVLRCECLPENNCAILEFQDVKGT